jgi:hypothetical protein
MPISSVFPLHLRIQTISKRCHGHQNYSSHLFRNNPSQRAHFAIFVPSAAEPKRGTLIHAVGAPMAGYILEFKRNYSPILTQQRHETFPIGQVYSSNIVDATDTAMTKDSTPRGNIEVAASQVPTPGISQNFMAPVNDVNSLI